MKTLSSLVCVALPQAALIAMSALLLVLTSSTGFLSAQTIPEAGDTLWKFVFSYKVADQHYPGLGLSAAAICYAQDVDLVIAGTTAGALLVLDGATGQQRDTVNLRALPYFINNMFLGIKIKGLRIIDVACSDDAKVIAVSVLGVNGIRTFNEVIALEYPSLRLIDTALWRSLEWDQRNGDQHRLRVSPKGRWVVTPFDFYVNGGRDTFQLIDLKTGIKRKIPETGWISKTFVCDFDDNETLFTYMSTGTIGTREVYNVITTLSLASPDAIPEQHNLWGSPQLSADGTKLLVSGEGLTFVPGSFHDNVRSYWLKPHATVYDLARRTNLWHIQGAFGRENEVGDVAFNFWSRDGTRLNTTRSKEKIPDEWRSGSGTSMRFIYQVGDTVPQYHITRGSQISYYRNTDDGTASAWNRELTRGFVIKDPGIICSSFEPRATSVNEGNSEQGKQGEAVLWPNPTTGEVTVRCKALTRATTWRLYHAVTGNAQANGAIERQQAQGQELRLRLPSDLATGGYLLQILSNADEVLCAFSVVKQ